MTAGPELLDVRRRLLRGRRRGRWRPRSSAATSSAGTTEHGDCARPHGTRVPRRRSRRLPRALPTRLGRAWRPGGEPLRRSAGARSRSSRSPARCSRRSCSGRCRCTWVVTSRSISATRSRRAGRSRGTGTRSRRQPLDFFQSNQFWPLRDTLAFSDALIGYTPAGLIGSGPARRRRPLRPPLPLRVRARVPRWLPARRARLGAPPLGRRRRRRRVRLCPVAPGAGRAPPRPLERRHPADAVPAAARLAAGARPGLVVGGLRGRGVADRRSVSASACSSPTCCSCSAACAALWWLRAGRPAPRGACSPRRSSAELLLAAVSLALARPYTRVLDAHPEAGAPSVTVSRYSGPPRMLPRGVRDEPRLGRARRPACATALRAVPEQTLFPGLAILAARDRRARLARVPARPAHRARRRRPRARGPLARLPGGRRSDATSPTGCSTRCCPGWEGIRVPGRLHTLTTLALALLAAAGGAARAAAAVGARAERRAAAVASPLLVLAVVVEGSGFGHRPRRRSARRLPAPDGSRRPRPGSPGSRRRCCSCPPRRRTTAATCSGRPTGSRAMLNGRSELRADVLRGTLRAARCFPGPRLRGAPAGIGVRTVVVHTDCPGPRRRVAARRRSGARARPAARAPRAGCSSTGSAGEGPGARARSGAAGVRAPAPAANAGRDEHDLPRQARVVDVALGGLPDAD